MLKEKFNLKGKVALVTGSARGIGKGFVEALAEYGANVVVADINYEGARKTASEIIANYGVDIIALYVDVTLTESIVEMINNILDHYGKLDIAVNNAAIATVESAENITDKMWDDVINVNLRGTFICCREEAKVMIKNGGGNIINMASQSGIIVNRPHRIAHYNASKAGVIMLTKSLASDWAEYNIRVNCISPGYTLTEMNEGPEVKDLRNTWINNYIPMKRMNKVEDLMGGLVYLCSDASSLTTGHNLIIDGGSTLW